MLAAALVLAAVAASKSPQQEITELIASLPPIDPIVGVASGSRGKLSDERWSSVVALFDPRSDGEPRADYRFLGRWNKAARERALAAGIDLVLVLEDTVAKKKKLEGGTYGNDEGDRVYVRTRGAYARTEAELLLLEPAARVIAHWTEETDKGKSLGVWVTEEEQKDRSALRERDPDVLLNVQIRDLCQRADAYRCAAWLWEHRERFETIVSQLSGEEAARFWSSARRAAGPLLPLASLRRAALTAWRSHIEGAKPATQECLWCNDPVGGTKFETWLEAGTSACCEKALSFASMLRFWNQGDRSALLGALDGRKRRLQLRSIPIGCPDASRRAFEWFELELAASEEMERETLREILAGRKDQKFSFGDPHVLLLRGEPQSIEPGTDLDLIRSGLRNVRVGSVEAGAPQWYKVPDSKPCLALVEHDSPHWKPIELVKGRKMTAENLERMIESALRGQASGSLDLP